MKAKSRRSRRRKESGKTLAVLPEGLKPTSDQWRLIDEEIGRRQATGGDLPLQADEVAFVVRGEMG
ncbi:MAG: hypothetical protein KDA80_11115 [Planctomycetaceae bacterium]|nr:hypothetical protein [Planctomycetaceae bacterium]